jgi:hypothetical protein
MSNKKKVSLVALVFIVLSGPVWAAPQVQDLAQSMRSEITANTQCGRVMVDYLARSIIGALPEGQGEAARPGEKLVGPEPTQGSTCETLVKRFVGLSESERLELARALATDADPYVSSLGASLLFTRGAVDEAVPVLAAAIARGQASRIYLARGYKGDTTVYGRITIKISRYLLERWDSFQGQERTNVQQYLSAWSSSIPFSRSEAQRRIDEAEANLGRPVQPIIIPRQEQ